MHVRDFLHALLYRPIMAYRVCVIGAGVIGLSTALRILQELPQCSVDIVSEEFSPNTTGDGAAGYWEPYAVGDTPQHLTTRWGRETFEWLESLATSSKSSESGAFFVTGSHFYDNETAEPQWKDTVRGFRRLTDHQLSFYPGHKCGYTYMTLMAEGRTYVAWLTQQCRQSGASFIYRKIHCFDEVALYNVVVNCSGLGSSELAKDASVFPIKGQIIIAKAPWIKQCLNFDDRGLYLLCGAEHIYMGGTTEHGKWTTDPDPKESERIWNGMMNILPSLRGAEKIGEWAGLRPGRKEIRLEMQGVESDGRKINVIHNYGHGGAGLTLHWGCAGDCVDIIRNLLPASKI